MDIIQALILGIIQGLTEFLPVSSSGHLEIAKVILGVEVHETLSFSIAVHGATVLSTIVVFRKEIARLLAGFFQFKWNNETQFIAKIVVSMIPVAIVGVFFNDYVESLFTGNLLLVGAMLLITALLLWLSSVIKHKESRPIGYLDAFLIGIAQAFAVLPGISRSGATIATGLMLGKKRPEVASFSFLMVLIPIIGANALDLIKKTPNEMAIDVLPIFVGFVAAFIVGYLACSWMVNLIKKGKLIWFALYCTVVGLLSIIASFI
ncbi:MAG TPA: undecaprenyl-diphosphate phosphatase [Tenuifilaceae bacterium]|nr:undecaprenyl-diphosphate phosphatase [Tenuifilaceae bacterium]